MLHIEGIFQQFKLQTINSILIFQIIVCVSVVSGICVNANTFGLKWR